MPVEGYKVDVSKAVGHKSPVQKVDPTFGPLPTYPLVLALKGEGADTNLFKERSQGETNPGIPSFDPNKIVHGEQALQIHKPFPKNGGQFNLQKTTTGVYDKGSGMVIEGTMDLYGAEDNVHYCTMVSKSFVRGYGGWNGPKGPKAPSYAPPKRQPDAVESFKTTEQQAQLYRLSGDYNPLHIDVPVARSVGFPNPILHGLCTYGITGHAILKHLAGNDSARFKSIEGRFSSPVFPGETVEVYMWKVDDKDPKVQGVIFAVKVKERDIVVINNGYATLYKESPASKL
ncbi:MaoC like domain-containing protein [Zychaea mexicana]|uniref:MaoC like domain-containing protein n=1 Tax=Zychaea mexicana TaxID=64656 RepID=UPI0022FEC3A2|nr:MaoC like domain-containing protein [Zychaea mexicana]KAI9491721.1 MaoC like domain-containing protein [Zychaea mexicana]